MQCHILSTVIRNVLMIIIILLWVIQRKLESFAARNDWDSCMYICMHIATCYVHDTV